MSVSGTERIVAFVGITLIPASVARVSIPPGYYVQQLTDNSWREDFPRINNAGQIVFSRWSGPGNTSELILWEKATGEFTQLTDDAVKDLFPDIADDGTIVWTKTIGPPDPNGFPTGETMLRRPDGTVIRLTDNAVHDLSPRVNNVGHIVWAGDTGTACGEPTVDVYLYDGRNITAITADSVPAHVANQTPSINDRDQVVWTKFDFCQNPWTSEIWMWDQGVRTRLTTDQRSPKAPDIAGNGLAAWFHRLPNGSDAIDLWQAGVTTRLTDWGSALRLNHDGMVAFHRWHGDAWQQWLYRDGTFFQLSDDPFWNHSGEINDVGEVVWISGPTSTSDTRFLRRFELGDLNCDGEVDAFDIDPFIDTLIDPERYRRRFPACDTMLADTNGDGRVDAFDIERFIQSLVP